MNNKFKKTEFRRISFREFDEYYEKYKKNDLEINNFSLWAASIMALYIRK